MPDVVSQIGAVLEALAPERDAEMADTPRRVAEFAASWLARGPMPELTLCEVATPDPVAVCDIRFHSLCAHHLLPFFGTISVAYAPRDRLAGLGAIAQLVGWCARRPTLQEHLSAEIADRLVEELAPAGLVVACSARHLCVEMRGATLPIEARTLASRGARVEELRELLRPSPLRA